MEEHVIGMKWVLLPHQLVINRRREKSYTDGVTERANGE